MYHFNCICQMMCACLFSQISIDVLVSVIISLFTFIMGYVITEIISKCYRYRTRKQIKRTIVECCSQVLSHLKDYVSNLQRFSTQVAQSDELINQQFKCNRIALSKLNEFSFDKLSDAILLHVKHKNKSDIPKMFFQYLSNIEYLIQVQKIIELHYDEYKNKSTDYVQQWNKLWPLFCKDLEDNLYRTRGDSTSTEANIYRTLYDALWKSKDTTINGQIALSALMLFFSKGAHALSTNVSSNYLADTRMLFSQLHIIIIQIEQLKKMSNVINDYVVYVQNVYNSLMNIKSFYSECTIRWW